MADKRIDELEAAASVTNNDLFVLEQAGTAKKLVAFTLETWLLQLAQGHGGITGIAKTGTAGTNPVVDTYTITFSDTSTTTFTVTNGIKGDTGAQTYVYIKYAAQEPTADSDLTDTPSAWMGICATTAATAPTTYGSYSWYEIKGANTYIKYSNREPIADSDLTDTPSAWMGVCVTTATTAPTTYGSYSWYEIKGDKGDPGNDITITSTSVSYQAWSSGTQYPTGTWLANPPAVTPGNYLWTRTIVNYSDGGQTVSYSVGRWGLDGSGAVASVNWELPDQNGNVTLTAANVGALPDSYQPPVTSVNNQTGTVVLDNEDVNAPFGKYVSATLSSAGWYRILQTGNPNGSNSAIIDIKITRNYYYSNNEAHYIRFIKVFQNALFLDETSKSNALIIDKIRYITDADHGYVDVHYASSSANTLCVDFDVATSSEQKQLIVSETLQSVADAPSGETVLETYTFAANTNGDVTSSYSITKSTGRLLTLDSAYRYGKVVHMQITAASSSAASEGSNIATGTLNGAKPSVMVLSAAYYDNRIAIIAINTDGAITVRLSKGSMESSYTVTFGFTFICS